jgi:hypothetical protein
MSKGLRLAEFWHTNVVNIFLKSDKAPNLVDKIISTIKTMFETKVLFKCCIKPNLHSESFLSKFLNCNMQQPGA